MRHMVENETKAIREERFWAITISTLLMKASYANDLGFTTFGIDALKAFLYGVLNEMRTEIKGAHSDMANPDNVSSILTQFLKAMGVRHPLRTNRIHVGRGKPAHGLIKPVGDTSKLDGVYVQIGLADKRLRMSQFQLSEWLRAQGISRKMFVDALKVQFNMTASTGRLASGTDHVAGTEYYFELDLAGHPQINFIDEV